MEPIKNVLKRADGSPQPTLTPPSAAPNCKPRPYPDSLRKRNIEREEARYQAELRQRGYAPLPGCPVCGGGGWVHALTADGRTVFGKIERCRHTGCFADSHARYRKGEHYLGMLGLATTPTMAEWRQVIGTEDSYAAVIALATGNTAPPMLLIYGGTGNGKSHLCNALGLALHERGIGVRLWRAPDMLAYLKAGMQDSSEDRRLDMIKAVPALILDDWGANYDTDWAKSRLDDLVGARYESNRRGERKVTVMTTNLDVSQLPPRVESRFADKDLSVTVLNRGADRRVEK